MSRIISGTTASRFTPSPQPQYYSNKTQTTLVKTSHKFTLLKARHPDMTMPLSGVKLWQLRFRVVPTIWFA